MLVWRLTKPEHAPGLDGEGSRLWGGRWNPPGIAMVYTASSLALAALEYFVHLPTISRQRGRMSPLVAVGLQVAPEFVTLFDLASLPQNYGMTDCRDAGLAWSVASKSLGLAVPSQVISRENNILLNPRHPDMRHVKIEIIEEFAFDDRLGL